MSQGNLRAEPAAVVIFGASGDLTQRKLVPAPHSLACDDLLHPDTRVVGVARSPMSDLSFHGHLYGGVEQYGRGASGRVLRRGRARAAHTHL